jgi:LacI family transcriptional regulator
MVRIRDVASQLNLSITTVSRALDGYSDVAEQTRQLVIQTAQEMGYVPNRAARQLRRQHAETIGFILPVEQVQFSDPFFSEFIAGIGDETTACNYDLLVSAATPDSDAELSAYQRWIQAGKVDGMIITRTRVQDSRISYLVEQKVPYVCLERSVSSPEFIGVEIDSYAGVFQLMGLLTKMGHRRIAYIGACPRLKVDYDRLTAYKAGLFSAGIVFDNELVIRSDLTLTGGYNAAETLLEMQCAPTAIVCINDLTAIGAMHAIHNRGLVVGRDVSVTGCDGLADSAHSQPPLTTIEQPVYSVARQLVKMLLAEIRGDEVSEKHIKIQPRVLLRSSIGRKLL